MGVLVLDIIQGFIAFISKGFRIFAPHTSTKEVLLEFFAKASVTAGADAERRPFSALPSEDTGKTFRRAVLF